MRLYGCIYDIDHPIILYDDDLGIYVCIYRYIPTPCSQNTSVAFGGSDLSILYITTASVCDNPNNSNDPDNPNDPNIA